MAGTLFVVATPIGNLEDLTFRALRTLKEVDVIAAEDTRRTSKLLAHYDVRKPLVSLREHNEARETARLISRLQAGENVALVSDAGTPTIADPGARLVRTAHEQHVRVVPIPGPSAVVAALSASGFGGDQFVFLGFPPPKGAARERWFEGLSHEKRVAVFFEAPHRIRRTLEDLMKFVKRPIVVGRELTKQHEQLVYQPIFGKYSEFPEIGEYCIVVKSHSDDTAEIIDNKEVEDIFGQLIDSKPLPEELANKLTSLYLGIPESSVRKVIKRARIAAKQRHNRPALT